MKIINDGVHPIVYESIQFTQAQYDAGDSDFTPSTFAKPPWQRVTNTLELTETGKRIAEMIDTAVQEGRVEVYTNTIWIMDYRCADDMWDTEEEEYVFEV